MTLSKGQVDRLLRHGVTERIEGFRAKSGRTFGARLRLGDGGKIVLDFSDAADSPWPSRRGAAPATRARARGGSSTRCGILHRPGTS